MDAQQGLALPALDAAGLATNPFRVLGLGPSASAAQIRRRTEQATAAHRLGAARPLDCILPLPSAPDDHLLRDAAHRLRDPMNRLLAEVFWFEPDLGPDPAWHLDRPTPTDTLMKTWIDLRWASEDAGRRAAAAHNVAILQLMLLSQACVDGKPAGSRAAWSDVPSHLASWLADDAAVRRVADRAAALGAAPAGIDLGIWRRELTRALLRPLVDLALLLLERGENSGAIQLLSPRNAIADALPSAAVQPDLRRLAGQVEDRLAGIIEDAWTRAQADQAAAVTVGQRLLTSARLWLDVLQAAATATTRGPSIVAPDDVGRLAHRLADILGACAINFLDPGDPLYRQRTACRLLAAAAQITHDAEQRDELLKNLEAVRQNIAHLERTGGQPPAADRPAADRPAADRPAADRPAADRPAALELLAVIVFIVIIVVFLVAIGSANRIGGADRDDAQTAATGDTQTAATGDAQTAATGDCLADAPGESLRLKKVDCSDPQARYTILAERDDIDQCVDVPGTIMAYQHGTSGNAACVGQKDFDRNRQINDIKVGECVELVSQGLPVEDVEAFKQVEDVEAFKVSCNRKDPHDRRVVAIRKDVQKHLAHFSYACAEVDDSSDLTEYRWGLSRPTEPWEPETWEPETWDRVLCLAEQ